jgi:signal transduction histidine kinase
VFLRCPDGSRRALLLSAGPLRDSAGGLAGAVLTLTDITERKHMEEELRRSRDELEQRVRQRTAELEGAQQRALQAERLAVIGQTMAGLAHESRNALQAIHACCERLGWRLAGQWEAVVLVDEIRRSQEALTHLYDDVRGYAAPLTLDRRTCRLATVWRRAWEDVLASHPGRGTELHEPNGDIDLTCVADPFRLGQVFANVFDNSLAACPDPVVVTVGCADTLLEGRHALRVSVRDNGPGLSEEQRRNLFQPFYTTKAKGTGLGMAIARRVVEAHGGRIAVREPARPGAEIVITLPRGDP